MPSQELSVVVMVADTLIIIVVKKLSISEQEQKKVNEGFAKYVGSLKPNETVLNLYEQILNDVRKEQSANVNETIAQLQNKMLVFQKRIQTAKDKYLDGEMSKS